MLDPLGMQLPTQALAAESFQRLRAVQQMPMPLLRELPIAFSQEEIPQRLGAGDAGLRILVERSLQEGHAFAVVALYELTAQGEARRNRLRLTLDEGTSHRERGLRTCSLVFLECRQRE